MNTEQLRDVRRLLCLTRANCMGPRGNLDKAADQNKIVDIDKYIGGLHGKINIGDYAAVVGELGGEEHVVDLLTAWARSEDLGTMRSILHSVSMIGGPMAVTFLRELLRDHAVDHSLRNNALHGILDLLTGNFDMYLMSVDKIELPYWLHADLHNLWAEPAWHDSIENIYHAFFLPGVD